MSGVAAKAKIEESFTQGVEKTKEEYKKVLQTEKTSWAQYQKLILDNLQARYESWLNEFMTLLPEYLVTIISHLLPQIDIKRETVEALVAALLKEANERQQQLTVFLSEKDAQWVNKFEEKFKDEYPLLNFEIDSSLASGDCRLKTSWGEIDGRLKARLEELKTFFRR